MSDPKDFAPDELLVWRFVEQTLWSTMTVPEPQPEPLSELEILARALGTNRNQKRGWKKGKPKGKRTWLPEHQIRKP